MKKIIKTLFTIIFLAVGAGVMYHLIMEKEHPEHIERPPMSVTVVVDDLHVGSAQVEIEAMGQVVAAREVDISPEVNGRVTYISPKLFMGSHFDAGELLLAIDPTDYKMAVERAQAAVAQAKVKLEEQEAYSAAAAQELKLLDKRGVGINESGKRLASRKAYVESAKAELDSAKSELEQAKVNLARTQVKAPFSSKVKSKNVEKGQVVTGGSTLVELVADDEVHVIMAVMLDQLKWLDIPEKSGEAGSRVEVVAQTTGITDIFQGAIISYLPELKEKSQLAQLLVRVPQKDNKQRLFIGSKVNCTIRGHKVDNVIPISRLALRDNSKIWVVNKDKRLAERQVEVVFSDRANYYLKNDLDLSERLITSRVALPIPGIMVRIDGEDPPEEVNYDDDHGHDHGHSH